MNVPAEPSNQTCVAHHCKLKAPEAGTVLRISKTNNADFMLKARAGPTQITDAELHDLVRPQQTVVSQAAEDFKTEV